MNCICTIGKVSTSEAAVCFYWHQKGTRGTAADKAGIVRFGSRARARWCSDEYSMYHTGMQQPNEETYPGPLLVNIDRPYPHRE